MFVLRDVVNFVAEHSSEPLLVSLGHSELSHGCVLHAVASSVVRHLLEQLGKILAAPECLGGHLRHLRVEH